MTFFKIVFCSLYKSFKKDKHDRDPDVSVIAILSILISLNLFTVYSCLFFLFRYKRQQIPIFYGGIFCLFIYFILYRFFIKDDRYLKIFEAFELEYSGKNTSSIITNFYWVLSLLAFAGAIFLK